MKKTRDKVVLITVLLLAIVMLMTACDLSGFTNALKTDISKCQITFDAPAYQYTGGEIFPFVQVKYKDKDLNEDTDYTLEYSNNIDIGKGLVKVSGKGNFKGQVEKSFNIVEDINDYSPDEDESGENALTYIFSADNAQVVDGKLTQKVKSVDELSAPIVQKRGYRFLGWTYEGEEADFEDISSLPQNGATFVAQFSIVTYTVEYVLNGGENSTLNKDSYTVEDYFELQDATKTNMQFVGWYLDEDLEERFESFAEAAENLKLYAKFVDFDPQKLSYVVPVGAEEIQSEMVYPGERLSQPDEVLSADGSKKLVWYLDKDMTIRHNLRIMPNAEVTLYARWEDSLYDGFLDRGWKSVNDIVSIDSYSDLLEYVEFVYFYGITQSNSRQIKVNYVSGRANIEAELNKAHSECTFPKHLSAGYTYGDNYCSYYLSDSASASIAQQATLSASSKEDYDPQINDVFANYRSSRTNDFDDFAINYVDKTYECTTSDQLFYILSHGYRPLPVSGSVAERIYKQFKDIMREICDDSMTDLQKTRAIFDWLILNVYYDHAVADAETSLKDSYKYDAFYIEGVLNGAAVCDGLSKAYASMCAIEGIDCVRITGKERGASETAAGHAWNKVQIMGEWFLSDATWGNRRVTPNNVSYYEFVSREYFLFTDEVRFEIDNYNSNEYGYYVANTKYNFYDGFKMQLEFTSNIPIVGGINRYTRTFDLYIDGDSLQDMSVAEELSYVLEFIDKSNVDLNGASFEIKFGERVSKDVFDEAMSLYRKRMLLSARIKGNYSLIGLRGNSEYIEKDDVIVVVFSLPQ